MESRIENFHLFTLCFLPEENNASLWPVVVVENTCNLVDPTLLSLLLMSSWSKSLALMLAIKLLWMWALCIGADYANVADVKTTVNWGGLKREIEGLDRIYPGRRSWNGKKTLREIRERTLGTKQHTNWQEKILVRTAEPPVAFSPSRCCTTNAD